MKKFITNAGISAVTNSDRNASQTSVVPNTCQAIVKLLNYGSVLQKTSKAKCKEVISCRKKAAKGYYFNMLRYSTIFSRKTRDLYDVIEKGGLSELKAACENSHKLLLTAVGETLRWRLASVHDIYCRDYAGKARGDVDTFEINHLFKSEAACQTYIF